MQKTGTLDTTKEEEIQAKRSQSKEDEKDDHSQNDLIKTGKRVE